MQCFAVSNRYGIQRLPYVVMVTQGSLRRLTLRDDLYIGGYVNYSATGLLQLSKRKHRLRGIVGCIRRLEINDKVYDMSRGAFIGDALHHVNIGMYTPSSHVDLCGRPTRSFASQKLLLSGLLCCCSLHQMLNRSPAGEHAVFVG